MAFDPVFPVWAGFGPILSAAKTIIDRDIEEALAWRASLDGSAILPRFARVQLSQYPSQEYPLLLIQPATDNKSRTGAGGVNQAMAFDCEIFCTKALIPENPDSVRNELTYEIIRYYDAVQFALMSAADEDWIADFPEGNDSGKIQPFVTNGAFGEIELSRTANGLYLRSMSFELVVSFTEAQ